MGPRIYPSFQDTNTTAKGTLILSMDLWINQVSIYINNNIWDVEYNIINGLCTIPLNVGDIIRIDSNEFFSINLNRFDYTTDDTNNDFGIKNTSINYTQTTNSYTFTATTLSSSYNFEYRSFISFPGPTPTPTVTPTPTATPTPSPTPTVTPTPTPTPTPIPGTNCGTQISLTSFDPIIYGWDYPIILGSLTGTTTISADMQLQPDRIIVYFDGVPVNDSGYVGDASKYNYGQSFRTQFNLYLSGRTDPITNLTYPNTGATNCAPDGFPYVSGTPVGSQTFYNSTFNKNTTTQNCFVKVMMPYPGSGLFFTIGCPPLPPTATPTPTPTATPAPTPVPNTYYVNAVFNAFNTSTNQKTVELYFTRSGLPDLLLGTFTYTGATYSGTTSTIGVSTLQVPSPNFYGFTQKWCSNTGNTITRINTDWSLYKNGSLQSGPNNTNTTGSVPICPTKTNGPGGAYSLFPAPATNDTLTFYVTSSFV